MDRMALLFVEIIRSSSSGLPIELIKNELQENQNFIIKCVFEHGGQITKTADDVFIAHFPDVYEAVKAGINIQRKNLEEKKSKVASFQMRVFVHYDKGTSQNGVVHGPVIDFIEGMKHHAKPGRIYVSQEVRRLAGGLKATEFLLVRGSGGTDQPVPLYDVVWQADTESAPAVDAAPALFTHTPMLVDGPHAPCFYCGAKRHPASGCPSKQLAFGTRGLDRLGRLTMVEMNGVFSKYFGQAGEDFPAMEQFEASENIDPTCLAPWSFYELKRGFQLRFFSAVATAGPKADWHQVREAKRENPKEGGMLWLAQDCIRTGQLDQADELLRTYGQKQAKDWRTYCGLAFISIEKGSCSFAVDFLNEALAYATTRLQKTYILLLLSRVYEYSADRYKAEDKLKSALGLEPYCPEASFEDIIKRFNGKQQTEALNRLVKLIYFYREYYTAALISPELTQFQHVIAPAMEQFLTKARKEATEAVEESDRAVETLKTLLEDGDEDRAYVLIMNEEMLQLREKPRGLFNCMDAVYLGKKIVGICKGIEQERWNRAASTIKNVQNRVRREIDGNPYVHRVPAQFHSVHQQLQRIEEGLAQPRPFKETLSDCEKLSAELDQAALLLKNIENKDAFYRLLVNFFKNLAFVFAITMVIALAIFPGVTHVLGRAGQPIFQDEWVIQQTIMALGSILAVLFAFFRVVFEYVHMSKRA